MLSCFALSACTNFLFQPSKVVHLPPAQAQLQYTDFYFQSLDQTKLHGWYLKSTGDKKGTILFLHGNAVNIGNHVSAVYWLPEYGYDVYLFDYRGYGNSEGQANLDGAMADIEAAMGYVTKAIKENEKVIVIGQSLGASMGLYAVAQSNHKDRVQAFVSIAAFSDYQKVTKEVLSRSWLTWLFQWPLSLTINNDYRPVDFVKNINPVAVHFIHGVEDQIIPMYHAKLLYDASVQPKTLTFITSGHNNVFNSEENRKKILSIIDSANQANN